jgi:(p)ppGpp synthase/HD superfamily hydrolase
MRILFNDELCRAMHLAAKWHDGDVDKGGEAYIGHPLRMAARAGRDRAAAIVALLHDVLEDHPEAADDPNWDFSSHIQKAVEALTKRKDDSYTDYITRLAGNPLARAVKILDLEDNMDIRRMSALSQKDKDRLMKYLMAYKTLRNWEMGENA